MEILHNLLHFDTSKMPSSQKFSGGDDNPEPPATTAFINHTMSTEDSTFGVPGDTFLHTVLNTKSDFLLQVPA